MAKTTFNSLQLPDLSQTMSSLEIAKLTDKPHDNVLKDIRRILEDAEIDAVRFNGIYLDAYKREKPCFNLPRLECDLIISGYSVKYRLAIIKRWHELEAKQAKPTLSYRDAVAGLLESLDEIERLNQVITDDNSAVATMREINLKNKEDDRLDRAAAYITRRVTH